MSEKVLISKSDLDRLADIISQKCGVPLPLTVSQMQIVLANYRPDQSNDISSTGGDD